MKKRVRLSASSLAVLLECPRCFWLQINENMRRPQGAFPSLPNGIDAVLKTAMDAHRKRGELPPELRGVTEGTLYSDQKQLDRWRDSLRGDLRYTDPALNVEVLGGIDDLLVEDGHFTPLDFKTRGYPVKDDTHRHYEHQLDLYAWLFTKLGHTVNERGVLLFFSPIAYEGKGTVQFRIEPVIMKTDVARAQGLLERAVAILQQSTPPRHAECVFCHFAMSRGLQDVAE
ncbi:MAG: hypothetical protein G01um1014106_260 [Parcubacteria group bacterium Gr01-1014_106]|nr:MAG: hypothetical protein G01um1014106_260 [Parcubacteria group bacterium Gr01-1014_106]